MISGYSQNGYVGKCLKIISKMLGVAGIRPTKFTFGSLLGSSSALELKNGVCLHTLMLKSGILNSDQFSGTALLGFYGKQGNLNDSLKVFMEMPERGVITWNSMIAAFANHRFTNDCTILFRELWRNRGHGGIEASSFTFLTLLTIGRSPEFSLYGETIHGIVIRLGMESDVTLTNALLEMYSNVSSGSPETAEKLFTTMTNSDTISWNTIITAFSKSRRPGRAVEFFFNMVFDGRYHPTETTFTSTITACCSLDPPEFFFGEIIHAKAIKNSLAKSEFTGTALLHFYANHKHLKHAEKIFEEIPTKTVVSWNTLITGYVNNDHSTVIPLRIMLHNGMCRPNEFTLSSAVKGSSFPELNQIHSLIIRMGYSDDGYVSAAVMSSYSSNGYFSDALGYASLLKTPLNSVSANIIAATYNRSGRYSDAQRLLGCINDTGDVTATSRNILIASCSRSGDLSGAFLILKQMMIGKNFPDNYAAVGLLSLCTNLNCLGLGTSLHGLLIKVQFESFDLFVQNVLLDMYGKCGNLEGSLKVFKEMGEKNMVSWTALISALGIHGHGILALQKFKQMETEGFIPDRVSLVTVLSTCRYTGLVEEGMALFRDMKSLYGIEPDMDHFVCVVDLLCKNGYLKEAEKVISNMPFQPNAAVWRIFLGHCNDITDIKYDFDYPFSKIESL